MRAGEKRSRSPNICIEDEGMSKIRPRLVANSCYGVMVDSSWCF